MESGKRKEMADRGRFLAAEYRERKPVRWLRISLLVLWDGVLLYMIVGCLIEPVYGAAFVAVVSMYLGYQL